MKQKSVGLTLRAAILALAITLLVAGSPALPPFDGVAYAQDTSVSVLDSSVLPNGSVQLDWDAVDGADSYRLWKGDGSGSSVSWGNSAHTTIDAPTIMYVDSAVTAGMTYSYVVQVYDGATRLGWSNVENVTIPGGTQKPTAKPAVTLAADGLSAITITWSEVPGADHYRVRYWASGLSGWMDIATQETGLTVTHRNLAPGTQYYYIVRGENAGGNGPYSGSPGQYDSLTLQATSATPVLTLDHTSRTVVEISWTPAPSGSTYNLHRRKVTTGADGTSDPKDDSGWERLPSGLLSATSYTDSAANYVPTDAGTEPRTVKYEYRVQAMDSNDVAGDWSAVKSVTIPSAGSVLSAPSTIGASAISSSSTRVTWAAVTGAAFYELQWKSGDGNYTNPFRVDGTTYEHGNLSPSTKYTYQVRAVDINGAGTWSSEDDETTLSVTAAAGQMPKVRNLTVTDATTNNTGATRTAKLTWSAVSGATHYEIARFNPGLDAPTWADAPDGNELDANGFITVDDAGSPPSWEDEIKKTSAAEGAGQTYYYVVSAVEDGVDNKVDTPADNELGEWSDYKRVTFVDFAPAAPPNPGKKAGLTAAKTNGASIIVTWTQPAAGRDADPLVGEATSWTIHWRTAATTTWRPIAVTGATSYHHTGLSGNTTYYYRVRAENSGGQSAFTDPVSETLGNTLTAPTGVRAVDATGDNPAIKVSWNAVTGADSYEVQRFGDGWGELSVKATAGTVTPVLTGTEVPDNNGGSNLMANTTYLYRVRMVKEGVMSGWSAVASGTTMAAAETDAPTLLATTTGQYMLLLSWEAVPGATAYHLEHLEGAQGAAVFENPNTNAPRITISGNFRNYVHTGRKAGTQYSYRLRAVLSDGEGDWTIADVQPWTKPAAPDVTASATDADTITLTWKATTTDAGSYRVEWRVANSGSAWEAVSASDKITANSCATTCELIDNDLTASTHYEYRIRAEAHKDAGGHSSYWDYTNQRTPAASSN